MIFLPFLLACAPELTEVAISGRVTDALGGGSAVPGAAVTIRGGDGGVWAETEASGEGEFRTTLPANQVFYLTAAASGFVPTAFSGYAGTQPLDARDGVVWLRSEADDAAIREEFAGCAAEGGGVVEGEVRLYIVPDADLQSLPLVTTASASAIDASGEAWPACYLDDEGASAPEAAQTGQTGRFAISGLPAGLYTLELSYADSAGDTHRYESFLYVPDGGVAPQYPALVGFEQ